jgi:hypothetical protein
MKLDLIARPSLSLCEDVPLDYNTYPLCQSSCAHTQLYRARPPRRPSISVVVMEIACSNWNSIIGEVLQYHIVRPGYGVGFFVCNDVNINQWTFNLVGLTR